MSNLISKNPFREKSALSKIYDALGRASKPILAVEVAKRAKVPLGKTQRMLAAMGNVFHNAGLRRIGVEIVHEKDGYKIRSCKADLKASRPKRGKAKVAAKKKAAVKLTKKSTTPKAKKKPVGAPPKPTPAPAPVHAAEVVSDEDWGDASKEKN